jgi:hypothetical protein
MEMYSNIVGVLSLCPSCDAGNGYEGVKYSTSFNTFLSLRSNYLSLENSAFLILYATCGFRMMRAPMMKPQLMDQTSTIEQSMSEKLKDQTGNRDHMGRSTNRLLLAAALKIHQTERQQKERKEKRMPAHS